MYICMHVYMCVYIYMYIYIRIYTRSRQDVKINSIYTKFDFEKETDFDAPLKIFGIMRAT